jgi:hypothetical protein
VVETGEVDGIGHEENPTLFKTRRWRGIVTAMAGLHGKAGGVTDNARQTTNKVSSRFCQIERDPGMVATL